MALPFLVFWVIIFLGRSDLGWRGVMLCIGIWLALLFGLYYAGFSSYIFVAAQALLDCILLLVVFGGDIRIK